MNFHLQKKRKPLTASKHFRYSLKFTSFITPNTITNLSLATTNSHKHNHNKILIKQSYILLIWLLYTKGAYSKFNESQHVPSFFIHKITQTKTTKLKTPMAHKTYSQEQFTLKLYTFSITFKSSIHYLSKCDSVNKSIYSILRFRETFPFFTTNLLFLKNFKFSFTSCDKNFMQLR